MHSRVKFLIKKYTQKEKEEDCIFLFFLFQNPRKPADPRRNLMSEYSILKTGSVYINFENHIFTPVLIPLRSYLAQTRLWSAGEPVCLVRRLCGPACRSLRSRLRVQRVSCTLTISHSQFLPLAQWWTWMSPLVVSIQYGKHHFINQAYSMRIFFGVL